MSDEQTPTPIDLLVDRLSQRIGSLTAENEWLKVQLELAMQQQQQGPEPPPFVNGQVVDDTMEGVGPV